MLQNIELALEALHRLNAGVGEGQDCRLVVAGAYDERLPQARAYMSHLLAIVDRLGLQNQVQPRQRLLPCDLCRLPCPPAPSHRAEYQDCEHCRSQLCTQISFIDW